MSRWLLCPVTTLLVLTLACSQAEPVNGPEVIYRMRFGRTLDVFNVDTSHFSREDIEYLERRDQQYGEFGGTVLFCSDEQYFCVRGGIAAAVPKTASSQRGWSVGRIDCEAESAFSGTADVINCTFAGTLTRFLFSEQRGIEWYEASGDPGIRWEAVGPGLFAAGTPSAEK